MRILVYQEPSGELLDGRLIDSAGLESLTLVISAFAAPLAELRGMLDSRANAKQFVG